MSNGNISECPNCHFTMKRRKAPFTYHGSYIGMFESFTCDFCKRVYFTEAAYKDIMEVPTSVADFQDFIEQEPNNFVKQRPGPPLIELGSVSDSHKNRVSTNEEDFLVS